MSGLNIHNFLLAMAHVVSMRKTMNIETLFWIFVPVLRTFLTLNVFIFPGIVRMHFLVWGPMELMGSYLSLPGPGKRPSGPDKVGKFRHLRRELCPWRTCLGAPSCVRRSLLLHVLRSMEAISQNWNLLAFKRTVINETEQLSSSCYQHFPITSFNSTSLPHYSLTCPFRVRRMCRKMGLWNLAKYVNFLVKVRETPF